MSSKELAVVMPGLSITRKSANRISRELTDGNHGMHKDVMVIPYGDYVRSPEEFDGRLSESVVYGQSIATLVVRQAAEVIACSGVEPELPHRLAIGMLKVAYNTHRTSESDASVDTLLESAGELLRNPMASAQAALRAIAGQSASRRLADNPHLFPDGRAVVVANYDGFGFNDRRSLAYAEKRGVTIHHLPTTHNSMFTHPRWFAKQLHAIRNPTLAA